MKKLFFLFCLFGNVCQAQNQKNDNTTQKTKTNIFRAEQVLMHKLLNAYPQGFRKGDLQRVESDALRQYVLAEEIYHSHTAQSYLRLTYCNSHENAKKEQQKQQKSLDMAKLAGYRTKAQIRSNVVFYVLGKDEKTQWGLNGAVVFLVESQDKWLTGAVISHFAGEE